MQATARHYCALLGPLLLTLLASPAQAQSLQGDLSPYDHPAYAGIASHFLLGNATVDGQTIFNGTAVMLCSDYLSKSLDEDPDPYSSPISIGFGTMEEMDVWDRFTASQDEGLVLAQVRWVADNYYEDYFLNPVGAINAKQYAFQNVIWEIFYDGGTAAGLDWSTGRLDRDKFANTATYGTELWSYMNELLDAVENSGVTSAYQGSIPIYATLDTRPGYQDYILITSDLAYPNIPEPGTALLSLLGTALLFRRRR